MKCVWLKLLLLGAFVFWATGFAKYAHEQIEHHGHDCSLDNDDDDDDAAPPASMALAPGPGPGPVTTGHPAPPAKPKHPCMVCQMLAAMVLDRSAPPVVVPPSMPLVSTTPVRSWSTPDLRSCSMTQARAPPERFSRI